MPVCYAGDAVRNIMDRPPIVDVTSAVSLHLHSAKQSLMLKFGSRPKLDEDAWNISECLEVKIRIPSNDNLSSQIQRKLRQNISELTLLERNFRVSRVSTKRKFIEGTVCRLMGASPFAQAKSSSLLLERNSRMFCIRHAAPSEIL